MRIISPLLKHVIYPGLSKSGLLRWSAQPRPAVVTYHGVLPAGYTPQSASLDGHLVTANAFRQQIILLKSRCNLISPEQFRLWCMGNAELPPRSVLLTCDDGLLNSLTDMLPIIRELDVPFLFFVTGASAAEDSSILWHEQLELWRLQAGEDISLQVPWRQEPYTARGGSQTLALWRELRRKLSGYNAAARETILEDMRIQIGISADWQAEYSQNESLRRRFFVLNRKQLGEVADAGVAIGAHTVSHPVLSQMPEELTFEEISASRCRLEEVLDRELWALAYPFGNPESVGIREAKLAARAGFSCAFMNVADSAPNLFSFPRIHVSLEMTLPELQAHISGLHQSIRRKFLAAAGGPVA